MTSYSGSFNEAARFTRRKHPCAADRRNRRNRRFNEAAGFTRRKRSMLARNADRHVVASMRPPDLPGGNAGLARRSAAPLAASFNEAAGFTRRKRTGTWTGVTTENRLQ